MNESINLKSPPMRPRWFLSPYNRSSAYNTLGIYMDPAVHGASPGLRDLQGFPEGPNMHFAK